MNIRMLKSVAILALFLSFLFIFCAAGTGCAAFRTGDMNAPQENAEEKTASRTEAQSEGRLRAVTITENRAGEIVFALSAEEFIDRYNECYRIDNGEAYLPELFTWEHYNTIGIHAEHEVICYTYSEDQSIRSIPTISMYVPTNGDYVQQIMVSYDDHSYSIPTYRMYEEMCFYTLKVVMPEYSSGKLTALYTELNDYIDEHLSGAPYASGAVPDILYYSGGVGVYPYFAAGEQLHFCVIPVTEEILASFAGQGTAIYEVPQE